VLKMFSRLRVVLLRCDSSRSVVWFDFVEGHGVTFKKWESLQACKSSAPDLLTHSFHEAACRLLACTRWLASYKTKTNP
jgi:hypothetical protein